MSSDRHLHPLSLPPLFWVPFPTLKTGLKRICWSLEVRLPSVSGFSDTHPLLRRNYHPSGRLSSSIDSFIPKSPMEEVFRKELKRSFLPRFEVSGNRNSDSCLWVETCTVDKYRYHERMTWLRRLDWLTSVWNRGFNGRTCTFGDSPSSSGRR